MHVSRDFIFSSVSKFLLVDEIKNLSEEEYVLWLNFIIT